MSKPVGDAKPVMVITGTRKGIGRFLAEYYLNKGYIVAGCSRAQSDLEHPDYRHYELDVADETAVRSMFADIQRRYRRLDALLNNAGIASMNHFALTPGRTVRNILDTNVVGTFLCCREAAKMMLRKGGRIVNFTTVAHPLNLEGEAIYASSKAAVESLTRVLARELGHSGTTVNAIGPTPVPTDLVAGVPQSKMDALLARQAIRRFGSCEDVVNVVDLV